MQLLFLLVIVLVCSNSIGIVGMKLHTVSSRVSSAHTKYPKLLLVLVHGLDSSSKTWTATMETLEHDVACIAVDQRGCGYSPLGILSDFSQDTMVADLHETIQQYCSNPQQEPPRIVLLGHSLGGRIAMGYAAKHPENLAACVIEDMDIAPREPAANGFVVLKDYEGVFDRFSSTKDELLQKFLNVGYPQSFLEKALTQGRMEAARSDNPLRSGLDTTGWWSHVNPDFRKYCYPHVLSTSQGGLDCDVLSKYPELPCHILVAGQETGTVCIEESVHEMHQRLGGNPKAIIHRYPTAGHSIHTTTADDFIATLRRILHEASTVIT